mgnify:CR=1 FL=1
MSNSFREWLLRLNPGAIVLATVGIVLITLVVFYGTKFYLSYKYQLGELSDRLEKEIENKLISSEKDVITNVKIAVVQPGKKFSMYVLISNPFNYPETFNVTVQCKNSLSGHGISTCDNWVTTKPIVKIQSNGYAIVPIYVKVDDYYKESYQYLVKVTSASGFSKTTDFYVKVE